MLRPTILIVDDNEALREVIHLHLEEGYEVLDAFDRASAFDVLRSHHVDLVLLDLLLPGADGLQILEELRQNDESVSVVILSGINSASTAATALRLGAADYLTKPIDELALHEVLRATLTNKLGASRLFRPQDSGLAQGADLPRLLAVGLDVGVTAMLSVALSRQCQVERATTLSCCLASAQREDVALVLVEPSKEALRTYEEQRSRVDATFCGRPIVFLDVLPRSLGTPSGSSASLGAMRSLGEIVDRIRVYAGQTGIEPPRLSSRIVRMFNHICGHYGGANIKSIGNAIGVAPYYLSRLYRSETGSTLRSCINRFRLEVAKHLLVETDETVDCIASLAGFHDASHLSRMFRAYTGLRPGAYRRRKRKGSFSAS